MSIPNPPEPAAERASPCRNLRHKGMYVFTDISTLDTFDPNQGTIFWCQKTLKSAGPDRDIVDLEGCCDGARNCYESP